MQIKPLIKAIHAQALGLNPVKPEHWGFRANISKSDFSQLYLSPELCYPMCCIVWRNKFLMAIRLCISQPGLDQPLTLPSWNFSFSFLCLDKFQYKPFTLKQLRLFLPLDSRNLPQEASPGASFCWALRGCAPPFLHWTSSRQDWRVVSFGLISPTYYFWAISTSPYAVCSAASISVEKPLSLRRLLKPGKLIASRLLAVFPLTARLGEAGLDLIVSHLRGKVNQFSLFM